MPRSRLLPCCLTCRCRAATTAAGCAQDVPAAINGLLASLPSQVSVQGLPFEVVFTYAVYTLNYVIVKVRLSSF